MEESMVERVARMTQLETVNKPFSWENVALAALEALREPTEEMIALGAGYCDFPYTGVIDTQEAYNQEIKTIWQCMVMASLGELPEQRKRAIDAALSEQKG
jgi:hypothetical protein